MTFRRTRPETIRCLLRASLTGLGYLPARDDLGSHAATASATMPPATFIIGLSYPSV